jgi:uncharacterized CHY-type Zn-finger protein
MWRRPSAAHLVYRSSKRCSHYTSKDDIARFACLVCRHWSAENRWLQSAAISGPKPYPQPMSETPDIFHIVVKKIASHKRRI